jgi:hypothetical protein
MTFRTNEHLQLAAARVAGLMYLLTIATGVFAEFYARARQIVPGDPAQTARNIAAHELLFRLGIVSDLITFAGCVILVVALYVVLEPVNRHVAMLAAFWRLGECVILAVITLNDFAALSLVSSADYLRAFDARQLEALVYTLIRMQGAGYLIGMVFFGLGSTVFSYLWLRSRYVPRLLAGFGLFASLVLAIVTPLIMVLPSLRAVVVPIYFVPIFLFEITMGVWLLVRGIRAPAPR